MRRFVHSLCCLLFAINAFAQVPVDLSELPDGVERIDIYLLMGQSNMKGRGSVPGGQANNALIVNMHLDTHEWHEAEHPLHLKSEPDNAGYGPGLDFAQTLLSNTNGVRIALVPCAVGGSWINLWLPGKPFYTNAIHKVQKALADAPPGVARIKGALWLQGESDSLENRYGVYSGKLTDLVQRLRSDLKEPALPFVACTIGSFIKPKGKYLHVAEINAALLALPKRVPHTACVDARDLKDGHIGDFMHYNTESQQIIGQRYAVEFLKLIKP